MCVKPRSVMLCGMHEEVMHDASAPIAVIGAGAAGLAAAIFAARAGAAVLLLESTREGGKKILISGGGRCNVLPASLDPSRFVTASSRHSLRKILLSWPLAAQRDFFERDLGVPLAFEEETGKFFPASNRARQVRDALLARCRSLPVRCRFGARVSSVHPDGEAGGWTIGLEGGEVLRAAAVVLATGGCSVPASGSDGAGLRMAAGLGHTIRPTYPALTPLICAPAVHAGLAGVALRVQVSAPRGAGPRTATGGFLFTHTGYSGPAVLDLSHRAVLSLMRGEREALAVSWGPSTEEDWERRLREGQGRILSLLREALPERLAAVLMAEASVEPAASLSHLPRARRRDLIERLVRYPLPWTGHEGYRKAEVTGGGIALEEVHPETLESRLRPGLHLCGEMLDAFGPIGGHNFAWAWASGRLAGEGAAARAGARMLRP